MDDRENAGKLSRVPIQAVLVDGDQWKAHGSKEMPTWGTVFQAVDGSERIATAHIHNPITYFESIQK